MSTFLKHMAGFSLLVCALAGCGTFQRDSAHSVAVGTAEIDITPPVGHRMAGYFDERLATGVHDPLLAKAVVLRQGNTRLAFVFCDLVGISLNVSAKARAEASRQTGIPAGNIMICGTHSHTGPLFDDVRRDFFHARAVAAQGKDPAEKIYYPDFLGSQIVTAIVEANAKFSTVELFAGQGQLAGYSFNRRYHMTNGAVQTNPGILNPGIVAPAGPVDHSVGVLQARSEGKPAATMTVFACHCDTCGGTQFSGDYPFFLAKTLRQILGNSHVSAFAAGTCGDINHINVTESNRITGYAKSEQIGTNLARAVLDTKLEPLKSPSLAVRSKTLRIPLQEVTPEQVALAKSQLGEVSSSTMPFMKKVETVKAADLASKGREWPMEVQVFRIDPDTAIVCLPGEIFVEFGLDIKKRSPFARTIVMTICNDRPTYVPTIKAFREGSYEVTNSRVKPGAGEKMVETALELLAELRKSH